MLKITNDIDEIKQQENAVVYFTAEWCNPCKQLKPHYAKAAVIDSERLYYLVDVDAIGSQYLNEYGIKSVPQIYEMHKGIINKKINGKNADDILKELGKNID